MCVRVCVYVCVHMCACVCAHVCVCGAQRRMRCRGAWAEWYACACSWSRAGACPGCSSQASSNFYVGVSPMPKFRSQAMEACMQLRTPFARHLEREVCWGIRLAARGSLHASKYRGATGACPPLTAGTGSAPTPSIEWMSLALLPSLVARA